ncbi:MAG: malonyl-ACP O-methyltransferase BioC [Muribaculaceae bacterium]|nr:malonyl-ACP O-methyltransferase BioC [Muribaculaceae bacterium]
MPIDIKNIKKQFEKSMSNYDNNAIVQNFMASKLVIELGKISTVFDNIFELGSGTGLLTKQIASSIEFKEYYANDLVEKSKVYVQKIVPNIHFVCGNALKVKAGRKFELLVSNAMFQWFENFEKAVEILKYNLKPGGVLAFSTFAPSNFKEITELTGLSLQYKTQDELTAALKNAGFEILYAETFYEEVCFKTPLELLAHMKHTGVNSLTERVWTVKNVKEFCDKYSKKYPKTKLTYSPIIIIARLKQGLPKT